MMTIRRALLLIIVTSLFMTGCVSTSIDIDNNSKESIIDTEWYADGTLHKSSVLEWKNATNRDRLATSADFAASAGSISTMEELRPMAEDMLSCINEMVENDVILDDSPVAEIAATCEVLLGD